MANKKDKQRADQRQNILETIINEDKKTRSQTKFRYKVLASMVSRMYPQTSEISFTTLMEIVRDAVLADRQLRMITRDTEKELKEQLSQEWQVNNGYHGHVKYYG